MRHVAPRGSWQLSGPTQDSRKFKDVGHDHLKKEDVVVKGCERNLDHLKSIPPIAVKLRVTKPHFHMRLIDQVRSSPS